MAQGLKHRIKQWFLARGWQLDCLHPARLSMVVARKLGYGLYPIDANYPLEPPIIGKDLLVLRDAEFRRSIEQVREHTLLDVARLANLWNLARQTGPGAMLEVGTFRGGGALHISNACPDRQMFIFDSFEGFRSLTPGLDDIFKSNPFHDTSEEHVRHLFRVANRSATIIRGFFPDSAAGLKLGPVAFGHLDVDIYEATRDSLSFLAPRLAPRSLVVIDDFRRGAHGLDRAVQEFLDKSPAFTCLPMFPGQAVLFSRELWEPR
jgi:O-methyltransferase